VLLPVFCKGRQLTVHLHSCTKRKIKNDEIEEWEDTRPVIVNKISFASQGDFQTVCKNLQKLKKQRYKLCGGIDMAFLGDCSQLAPVRQDPIHTKDDHCPEFHGALNCYIELDGKHRFKSDPEFGELDFCMREGNPRLDDIRKLNKNCLVGPNHKPNPNVQVATHFNEERDAVNASVFNQFCMDNGPADGNVHNGALVALMDQLCVNDLGKTMAPVKSNAVKRCFWETVGESDCKTTEIRGPGWMDPWLKPHC